MINLGILISDEHSNLQYLIDRTKQDSFFKITAVIANKLCFGLERSKQNDIPAYLFDKYNFFDKVHDVFVKNRINFIFLLGTITVSRTFQKKWHKKIIEIYPALLPKYNDINLELDIHKAVLNAKHKTSGATAYFRDNQNDIITQKTCPVFDNDSPEVLGHRVSLVEQSVLNDVLNTISLV